jgi:hypothetical protein
LVAACATSISNLSLELRTGEIALLDVTGTPIERIWNVAHMSSKRLPPASESCRAYLLEHTAEFLGKEYGGLMPGGGWPEVLPSRGADCLLAFHNAGIEWSTQRRRVKCSGKNAKPLDHIRPIVQKPACRWVGPSGASLVT